MHPTRPVPILASVNHILPFCNMHTHEQTSQHHHQRGNQGELRNSPPSTNNQIRTHGQHFVRQIRIVGRAGGGTVFRVGIGARVGFAVGDEVVVEGWDVGFAGAGVLCVSFCWAFNGGKREVRGLESVELFWGDRGMGRRGEGGMVRDMLFIKEHLKPALLQSHQPILFRGRGGR